MQRADWRNADPLYQQLAHPTVGVSCYKKWEDMIDYCEREIYRIGGEKSEELCVCVCMVKKGVTTCLETRNERGINGVNVRAEVAQHKRVWVVVKRNTLVGFFMCSVQMAVCLLS